MIKGFIAPGANTNEEDVLAVKKSLADIGFYKIPKEGLTPYADKEVFEAISKFQRNYNVKVTGGFKNGDETDKKLDDVLYNRAPVERCPNCGAPHGGYQGPLCPDCEKKES